MRTGLSTVTFSSEVREIVWDVKFCLIDQLTCRGSDFSWQRHCAGRPRDWVQDQTSPLLKVAGGSASGTYGYPGSGQPGLSRPPVMYWGTSGHKRKPLNTNWPRMDLRPLKAAENVQLATLAQTARPWLCKKGCNRTLASLCNTFTKKTCVVLLCSLNNVCLISPSVMVWSCCALHLG